MNEGETEREREREKRMVMRVDEPRMSALFAELTHYQNTLLVPMVRSGPSGSVVHGGPSLPGERYAVRKHPLRFRLSSAPAIFENIGAES